MYRQISGPILALACFATTFVIGGCPSNKQQPGNRSTPEQQLSTVTTQLLSAGAGDGSIDAAAADFGLAVTGICQADPSNAPEQIRKLILAQVQTPEDVERLYQTEKALAGKSIWFGGEAVRAAGVLGKTATASNKGIIAIYTNGINTSLADACADAATWYNVLIAQQKDSPIRGICLHYNVSATDSETSIWSGRLCPAITWYTLGSQEACKGGGFLVDAFYDSTIDEILEWTQRGDLGVDGHDLAQMIAADLDEGYQVILLAHSQGNFKTQQAMESLWSTYPDRWKIVSNVGVVGVASPASYEAVIPHAIPVKKFSIRSTGITWSDLINKVGTYKLLDLVLPGAGMSQAMHDLRLFDWVTLIDGEHANEQTLDNDLGLLFTQVHGLRESYLCRGLNDKGEAVLDETTAVAKPSKNRGIIRDYILKTLCPSLGAAYKPLTAVVAADPANIQIGQSTTLSNYLKTSFMTKSL